MEFFKEADPRFYKLVTFTKTLRHAPTPSTDPRNINLPSGFSVCVIGASADGIGEHITITARDASSLVPVAANVNSISASTTVSMTSCDVSSYDSVSKLASTVTSGLDCIIIVPASSPPFTADNLDDSPQDYTDAYLTDTVGCLYVAKAFIPLLHAKKTGAKSFLAISSMNANLTARSGAQIAHNISKLAAIRTMEQLSCQFEKEGILTAAVHPGLTKMSAKYLPKDKWWMLEDSKGLCGAVCVWLAKDAEDTRKWLNGRYVSSCWDMDELVARREEIVEKNLLKYSMDV